MAARTSGSRRRVDTGPGDWRAHYEQLWNTTMTTTPTDGMTLAAFIAARDAIFAAAKAFDLPADCTRCQHFAMGDCKKHGQPVPLEFQSQAEACADWQFDGIPF